MVKYTYDSSGNLFTATVSNIVKPLIINQPVRIIAAPGEIATLSVVIGNQAGVTCQWRFNGTDIPGATGDSLLLTNISAANEGQYSVAVTNSAGSVTSTPAEFLLDTDDDGLPDSW